MIRMLAAGQLGRVAEQRDWPGTEMRQSHRRGGVGEGEGVLFVQNSSLPEHACALLLSCCVWSPSLVRSISATEPPSLCAPFRLPCACVAPPDTKGISNYLTLENSAFPGHFLSSVMPKVRTRPRAHLIRSGPVRSGQIRFDPTRSDQIRSDPVRSGPIRPDPIWSRPMRFVRFRMNSFSADGI